MTADQLHKMQEESRKRHHGPFFNLTIIVPKEEAKTYAEAVEAPKTLSQLIDESYEFREGELKPKKQKRKKKEKIILPDLMAAEIPLPCTSTKNKEEIMKDRKWLSFDKPYVPVPVQKKQIFKSPGITPDPPKQHWERPPATYSNSKSYYGIYDELKEEWNKKTG